MPAEFSDLYKLSVIDKDVDQAREIYSYILPVIE